MLDLPLGIALCLCRIVRPIWEMRLFTIKEREVECAIPPPTFQPGGKRPRSSFEEAAETTLLPSLVSACPVSTIALLLEELGKFLVAIRFLDMILARKAEAQGGSNARRLTGTEVSGARVQLEKIAEPAVTEERRQLLALQELADCCREILTFVNLADSDPAVLDHHATDSPSSSRPWT